MALPNLNALDVVVLLLVLTAASRGFRRGALSQVTAFGGAGAGLVLGARTAPDLAGLLVHEPGPTLALTTLGLLLAGVLIGQTLGLALGARLRDAAQHLGAAALDRAAGVAVGVAGVLLTVWLLASALVQGPSALLAQQIRDSSVVAAFDDRLPPPPDVFSRVGAYLDQHGFPQVFSALGGATAPPVDPPSEGMVAAAATAGADGTVQVHGLGCGGVSTGSGFVTQPGFVVTNAHVVAGIEQLSVHDRSGTHEAVTVLFDPDADVAVLSAPTLTAPPLPWAASPSERGAQGATLGYPGGRRTLEVKPAAVRARGSAVGRDIYGRGLVERQVLTLSSGIERGDSGGPFVTGDGWVAGVVFAAATAEPGTGYALDAESVRPAVDAAVAGNAPVGTGECRF